MSNHLPKEEGLNSRLHFDRDFFEARFTEDRDLEGARVHLRDAARNALEAASSPGGRDELAAVLTYLDLDLQHDSEGRDLKVDKRSFSRTEIAVAMSHAPSDRVRYLIYRYRFDRYPREHRVGDFPILLAIEPTSVCNLRCVMCFQSDPALAGAPDLMGFMDFDLYRRVIDEGAEHQLSAVVLASRGEPLLHPRIGEMIKYAKSNGILDVKLNTNATLLTESKAHAILEGGLDTLVFSVDSHEKERYERIRVGASFDRVIRNIEKFHEVRSKHYPKSRTRTRVSMVQLGPDQDPESAYKFWQGRVDEFGQRWAVERLKIYDFDVVSLNRPCSLLWERLYIWYDGKINTCDEDYLSQMCLGSLNFTTIRDAWRSDKLEHYRARHLAQRKCEFFPCDRCHGF